MKNREFKRLRKRKSDQQIKEECMKGKHNKLTDRQFGIVCEESGTGRGGIAFKYKPKKKKKEKESEKGFIIPKAYQKKEIEIEYRSDCNER